jgi:hypothetical protein
MSKSVFGLFSPRPAGGRSGSGATPGNRFRPSVEDLEDRRVLSTIHVHVPHVHALMRAARADLATASATPAPAAAAVPLSITGVTLRQGKLVAHGLLGNIPFTTPLTLSPPPATSPAAAAHAATTGTSILNLQLAPIHLDLLGLKVDTSPICLAVTAVPGSGNLLGNLLSGIAGSLNSGTPLSSVLKGLSGTDLGSLTSDLTGLLNGALGNLTSPSSSATPAAPTGRVTNILHLSLGPVDLNLLGLDVHLDNCSNGPVTLDLSAQRGPGNLLGNLLSGVAHALDGGIGTTAADALLTSVADDIFSQL